MGIVTSRISSTSLNFTPSSFCTAVDFLDIFVENLSIIPCLVGVTSPFGLITVLSSCKVVTSLLLVLPLAGSVCPCTYRFFFLVISTIFLSVAVLCFFEPFENPLKLSSWLALLLLDPLLTISSSRKLRLSLLLDGKVAFLGRSAGLVLHLVVYGVISYYCFMLNIPAEF